MIKKIKTSQLKLGMFVHDFNCSWFTHPFVKNRLMITDQGMIDKVISYDIKEVYIDTAQGIDIGGGVIGKGETVVAEMPEEIPTPGTPAIILDTFEETLALLKPRSVGDEIPQALRLREKAQKLLESVFADVRSGKQIDIAPTRDMAEDMVKSAYRNSAAMPCVAKLSDAGDGLLSHSINVCSLMVAFCRHAGMDAETTLDAAIGALLHDVGMLKVDPRVLSLQGQATPEEFQEQSKHVQYSYEILSETPGVPLVARQIGELHHERYDGQGYPYGLKGDNIPQIIQMASIVNTYDALTSKKANNSGLKATMGLKRIFEIAARGVLNEKLVHDFIRCMGLYPIGTMVRLSSDKVGVVIRQNPESLLKPLVRVLYDLKKDCYIRPRDLDFANLPENRQNERIVANENSSKWNIDILQYIH